MRKRKELTDSPTRWKRIYKTYGLTREAYNKILQDQNGVCFICQRSPYEIKRRQHLSIDHDHTTGRIRGALCYNCNNRILGIAIRDDIGVARRILEYLTRTTEYGKIP